MFHLSHALADQERKHDSRVEADSCYRQLYVIFYKWRTFSYHNYHRATAWLALFREQKLNS